MPHIVPHIIRSTQVQPGDVIFAVGGQRGHVLCGRTVEHVEVKVKLVHIITRGEPVRTVPLNESLEVRRSESTPEEFDVLDRERALRYIQDNIAGSVIAVTDAKRKLEEDLEFGPDYWGSRAADVAAAQTTARLWGKVARVAASGLYQGDLIAATRAVMAEVSDGMVDLAFTSRSTCVISNAFEDVVRNAQARWVRYLRSYLTPER